LETSKQKRHTKSFRQRDEAEQAAKLIQGEKKVLTDCEKAKRRQYYYLNKERISKKARKDRIADKRRYQRYDKAWNHKKITTLHNCYVRGLISQGSILKPSEIPVELIALKREIMINQKLKRSMQNG